MLVGIDPILSPDLLHALRSMGHRHDIAVVDANFPCDPDQPRVIRLDGVSATDVLAAIVSVLPIETAEDSAWRMVADGDPGLEMPAFTDFTRVLGRPLTPIDPADFKQRVGAAYAVVVTGERRLWASVIVRKGVVNL